MKINKNILNVLSIVVIVGALAGCGTTAQSGKNENNNSGSGKENSEIVAGSIVPSIMEVKDGSHQYVFELKNDTTEDVTLSMNSSQYFDYHLIDDAGTVVYTDSENKMFTQMLQEKVLKPGENLQMELDATEGLTTLPEGTYTLEVWSTAKETEDWKASTEVIWDGVKVTDSQPSGEKLKVEEASVTYVGLQDVNSIEVTNEQNETEAMRLSEVAKPFFNELEPGAKITVFYVVIDGQKVIQIATKE
jgi:hypothetical protein